MGTRLGDWGVDGSKTESMTEGEKKTRINIDASLTSEFRDTVESNNFSALTQSNNFSVLTQSNNFSVLTQSNNVSVLTQSNNFSVLTHCLTKLFRDLLHDDTSLN